MQNMKIIEIYKLLNFLVKTEVIRNKNGLKLIFYNIRALLDVLSL